VPYLILITLLFSFNVQSAKPLIKDVLKAQSKAIKRQSSFSSSGKMTFFSQRSGKIVVPYKFSWQSPNIYQVRLSNVPHQFLRNNGNTNILLTRVKQRCILQIGANSFACPRQALWSRLTLSGDESMLMKSLLKSSFINQRDLTQKEINITDQSTITNNRITLQLGQNGPSPKAVLRIESLSPTGQNSEGSFPYIDFDQYFYSPLSYVFSHEGDVVELRASSDLTTRRKRRKSFNLAKGLTLHFNGQKVVQFMRGESQSGSGFSQYSKSNSPNFNESFSLLSSEGQKLLSALVLSH